MYLFELIPCVLRHPLDTFRLIKADRRRFSWLPLMPPRTPAVTMMIR